MKYSPTWMSDNFPMEKLECQYFDICSWYHPDRCAYSSPCTLRQNLKGTLEKYVGRDNLKFQVSLIIQENKRNE